MSEKDPRYEAVNALHAQGYPAVTRVEAAKYARAIERRFGKLADASAAREFPMWKMPRYQRTDGRRCWASSKPTTDHRNGWGRLIHDMGHMIHRYRHPGVSPHAHGEHAIETEIAYYVRHQTDWLKPKVEVKSTLLVRVVQATDHDAKLLAKWESKRKRAETAIRKLKLRIKARQRRAAKAMEVT